MITVAFVLLYFLERVDVMPPDTVKEFFLYCNNESLQEQKIPDVLPAVQAPEASTGLNNGFCFGTEIRLGLNLDIAALPVKQRYFIHCLAKGWRPSIAGLLGFIRLLQLGYYKTL